MAKMFVGVLALIVFLILPTWSAAGGGRTLGEYRFIPTPAVRDPFITTYFRNATGASIASGVNLPILIVPTEPPDTLLTLKGDFVFILTEMEYQYAFNERFALRAGISGASRVGTSGQSMVSQGVTATWGFDLGLSAALWQNNNVLVSALADMRTGTVLIIDPLGYVDDILSGNSAAPSLVTTDVRTRFAGGAAAAWAINPWSGMTGYFEAGHSNTTSADGTLIWAAAFSGGVDFGQRDQAPVGLLASAEFQRLPDAASFADEVISSVALGLSYTGREDLNVGGELKWSHLPLELRGTSAKPITLSGVLRYFF